MKTIFTFLAVGLFAFAATAQNQMGTSKDKMTGTKETKMVTEKKYWCTQCDYSSTKMGVCPTHKTDMVMQNWYFCAGDEKNATAKPGKCTDGTAMVRMDEAYVKKNKMMGEKMEKEKMPSKK